jgi:ADP-heptose:LPS heptosyltransferase
VISKDSSLNHIANSFDVISFIMSGFTNNEFIKYKNSIIISHELQIECAPCYLKPPCYREKKFCTEDINVDLVKKIISGNNINLD